MTALKLSPADVRGSNNRSAAVRAVIRSNGPCTLNEICIALGISDSYTRCAIRSTLRAMKQDQVVTCTDGAKPHRWSILREPQERNFLNPPKSRDQVWAEKAAAAYKNAEAAYLQWRADTAHDKRPIAQRVREIAKQLGEATADQIYTALGLTPEVGRVRMYSIIHCLARDGMLERIPGRPLRYRWLRDPSPSSRPQRRSGGADSARRTAKLQREAEKEAARQQRATARKEAMAQRAALRVQERDKRAAERTRRARERAEELAQKQGAHIARLAAATARMAERTAVTPKPAAMASETVDQWIARTGKQPELLPNNFDDPITSFPRRRPIFNPKGHTA